MILSFKKPTVKSDSKKPTDSMDKALVTSKAMKQLELLLSRLSDNKGYKLEDIEGLIGLKRTRTRELVKLLVMEGRLLEKGTIRDKRYQLKGTE